MRVMETRSRDATLIWISEIAIMEQAGNCANKQWSIIHCVLHGNNTYVNSYRLS